DRARRRASQKAKSRYPCQRLAGPFYSGVFSAIRNPSAWRGAVTGAGRAARARWTARSLAATSAPTSTAAAPIWILRGAIFSLRGRRSVSRFSLPPCRWGRRAGCPRPLWGGGAGWGVGPIPAPRRRHRWSCLRLTLASLRHDHRWRLRLTLASLGLARRKSAPTRG